MYFSSVFLYASLIEKRDKRLAENFVTKYMFFNLMKSTMSDEKIGSAMQAASILAILSSVAKCGLVLDELFNSKYKLERINKVIELINSAKIV